MARVLRPGGRLALAVRMCQVNFLALDQPPETRNPNAYRDLEERVDRLASALRAVVWR